MSNQVEHGGHDEAEIHLPDPSVWPLVVGFTVFLFGAALIFWSRDRDHAFAGPLLGAALLANLFAAAGWAWQDSIMRRKAQTGEHEDERSPRFSQVITFAIAEGQLDAARTEEGVLNVIDNADLRDLAGFQDLRIQVSPAAVGPSQVLVETTWSGRESLPTYEASRQTLLDRIGSFESQIVPGSVQVFDMDVVRDTKETAFKFSIGAAVTVFGSLALGGLMVGAALSAFQNDTPVAAGGGGGGGTPAPADPYQVIATDNKFDKATLQAPPNTEVTFTLVNNGRTKHNISFYTEEGGDEIHAGAIIDGGGTTSAETFTTPDVGSYFFMCDLHPVEMRGTLEVTPDAPPPGGGGGGGEAPEGGVVVTADNLEFDTNRLEATAGEEYSVVLKNEDTAPHNIAFYTDSSISEPLTPDSIGEVIRTGQESTLTFTPPAPGEYFFHCDLHPQMQGTFVVN